MSRFRQFFLSACLFALPVIPALAQDQSATADKVEIVTDEDAGAVRILIDGKPVVIIDETGLHVRGDISYGGKLTDYGTSGFDSHTAEAGHDEE